MVTLSGLIKAQGILLCGWPCSVNFCGKVHVDKTLYLSSESWPFPGDSSAPVFRLVMKLN